EGAGLRRGKVGRAGLEPATLGLRVAPGDLTWSHVVTESTAKRQLSARSATTESHVVSRGRVAPAWPPRPACVPGEGPLGQPQTTAFRRAASRNHSALSFGVRSSVSKST